MSLALRVMGYKIKSLKILPPGSSRNCPMLLFNIPLSNCAVLLLALGYIKKGREGFCSVFLSWLIWLELAAADLWDQSQWFNNPKFLNKISFLWQPWVCVQLPSCMWLFVTPWTATYQASLSLTTSQSLPKFMSIESVMPFQPSHPQLPSSPSTFNLSQHQGLFKWVGCSHQVAKVLELQLQHQSFQWILRVDFL